MIGNERPTTNFLTEIDRDSLNWKNNILIDNYFYISMQLKFVGKITVLSYIYKAP